jgi:GTP cyclohydrolase IA
MDKAAARKAIAEFLRALGRDAATEPELADTPARVVDAFADELLSGYAVDLRALVLDGSTLAATPSGIVALRDLSVATVCPHHLMPGLGRANVVYRPGERVLGLGAIARLVDACARRLVLQETIAEDVVRALFEHAGARGAYCEVTLVHGCLSARGACQANARATSIVRRGELSEGDVLLAIPPREGRSA